MRVCSRTFWGRRSRQSSEPSQKLRELAALPTEQTRGDMTLPQDESICVCWRGGGCRKELVTEQGSQVNMQVRRSQLRAWSG